MITRLPTLIAGLTVVGLLAWLGYDDATTSSAPAVPTLVFQERGGGSEVPCDVPLAWRVTRVDPQFGLTIQEATAVVAEAAQLWEGGTGRSLFRHDPEAGLPVRLVYDDRQERLEERERRAAQLDAMLADLTDRRTGLDARSAAYRASMEEYAARIADLDRRVGEHNAAVREWNDSRDQSDERWQALELAGGELQRERVGLVAERPVLDAEQNALQAATEELNRGVSEYDRLASELESDLPPEGVEAGIYREAVSRQGAEVVSVSREIRLYRFANADELRLLAAHEMGHALGLGHLDGEGSVMSASARSDQPVTGLASADRDLFSSVCPAAPTD